jgi:gluconolactonase
MKVRNAELVAEGLAFPEGPVVLPDGRVVIVEEGLGCLSFFRDGRLIDRVIVGGKPNGLALGPEDQLYCTRGAGTDRLPPAVIRLSLASGEWEVVTERADGRPLRAPNDLCFGPDGALYFTDPDAYAPEDTAIRGWVCRHDGEGTEVLFELQNVHPNGLAFSSDGDLVWVESVSRRVIRVVDGHPSTIAQLDGPALPDGCAFSSTDELVIATFFSGGLHVVAWGGSRPSPTAIRWTPEEVRPTNVAFEGSRLWVTDAGPRFEDRSTPSGRLWRLETDTKGLALLGGSTMA